MLDTKFIRENIDAVKKNTKRRGYDVDIDTVVQLDEQRRNLLQAIEQLRATQNKQPKGKPSAEALAALKEASEKKKELEKQLQTIEEQLQQVVRMIPNMAASDVPDGGEDDAIEVRKVGEVPQFDFTPKDHLELGETLNIIDMERAGKVSGARFAYIKNQLVMLELGLVRFVMDTLTKEGFEPVLPPLMISGESMAGMGYLEHGAGTEKYHLEQDKLYLIGTAEHALGPMHKDEILDEKDLPRRYVGFSPCFRREAGSYGKDTRGIIRMHQFDKLEMFSLTKPEDSEAEQLHFLSLAEGMLQTLEIPYRVMRLAAQDIPMPNYRTYDIESWIPTLKKYRETHSISSTTDFQTRRLNIRYRTGRGTEFVHAVNGTAFAIGRIMVVIMENFQQADGSIAIPKALVPYCGFSIITKK